jgi:hypothetical protein
VVKQVAKAAKKTNVWLTIGGGFLLLFVVALAIFLLLHAWQGLLATPPAIATPVVAGLLAVFGSVFPVIWAQNKQRQREIEQEHRKEKNQSTKSLSNFGLRYLLHKNWVTNRFLRRRSSNFLASSLKNL